MTCIAHSNLNNTKAHYIANNIDKDKGDVQITVWGVYHQQWPLRVYSFGKT